MKAILLPAFLLFFCAAHAQSSSDSDAAVVQFRAEHQQQMALQSETRHKSLMMFIGYDALFLDNIRQYLDDHHGISSFNQDLQFSFVAFSGNGPDGRITLRAELDQDQKMRAVRIIGTPSLVSNLFLNYWPHDKLYDESELQEKDFIRQRLQNDEISFYWNKGRPYIEIKAATPKNKKPRD